MTKQTEETEVSVAVDVKKSEYSEEFDNLRKNRIMVSFYKYGPARDNFGGGNEGGFIYPGDVVIMAEVIEI